MPNKYPGGYQIIDLGDLSKYKAYANQATTAIVPGLYRNVQHSNKPLVFTGSGVSVTGVRAEELKNLYLMSEIGSRATEDDKNFVYGSLWVDTDTLTDDPPSLSIALIINVDDKVTIDLF